MKTKTTLRLVLCAGAGALALTMSSCASSGSSPRSGASAPPEIEPSLANAQRRREKSIEHYNTASQLHLDGKPDEALAEYRTALELNDKLYAAWNNMGQLLMDQGNYADAVSAFQIASKMEPTDPRPEYNIGLTYQKVGWAQDSYLHFEQAIGRDPNYMPALRGLIRSAEMLGMGDQKILEHIRNAQLRETDEQWRAYLSTQFYRVQAYLTNQGSDE